MSNNFKDSPQVHDAMERIRKGGWDNANPKDVVFYVGANIYDHIYGVKEELEKQIGDVQSRMENRDDVTQSLDSIRKEIHLFGNDLHRQMKKMKVMMWCVGGGLAAMIITYIVIHLWLVPQVVIR